MADDRTYYHVVLTVTRTKPVFLVAEIDDAFKLLVQELARKQGWAVIELETMPDHVHLLLEKAPWQDLDRIVKALKGFTANHLLRQFGWLRGELNSIHRDRRRMPRAFRPGRNAPRPAGRTSHRIDLIPQ